MKYLSVNFLTKILFVINTMICENLAYKILGIMPTAMKSHYNVGSALMKGLAEKGHDVTVISPFPLKTPIKNWRDIQLYNLDNLMANVGTQMVQNKQQGIIGTHEAILKLGTLLTNSTLNEINVQKLLKSKNEQFDLIILEIFINDAMLGFGYHFNAPIIGLSTFGASTWTCDLVGSPSPPSFIPNIYLDLTDHMTLYGRILNTLATIFDRIFTDFILFPRQEEIYNQIFKDINKPKLSDIKRNVSLVLLNNHFSISYPRPYVPNMIEVGGMHVNRKQKQLPIDLKKILDSSTKYGVIYFSMGSHLKSSSLDKDKLQSILNVFKTLKQTVLWKWENDTLPGKSDNVFIRNWFPQDDILAHPNVKLFITHGGLLSTTEAIYHGVPIIGIPMFADQFLNMARAVKAGYGLKVDYKEINENNLKLAVNDILDNPKYTLKMKEISKIYRDQPMTPLDTAIYWVEYVLRHKGAPHLHSAGQDLSFIEYHNLDAFAIIFSIVFLVFYLIFIVIRKITRLIFDRNNVKRKNE